jgi:hypothetical protein
MATYIPNVNPYLPEVKTFTPDYKFLSDALTQRQGKYNTNYKQLNNAYSKIVYTELSRGDTNDARTQFVNNLQPEIEKISGLDLSLAQNTRAAQGVFQPFYDNDLVVKDMVMTKDYRSKMAYAQGLAESSKEEDNQKYWDEGVKAIQYKMDDFINASQEDALNSYLPSYTQNPQLHKRAMAYLKEQGYSMKYDEISKDGNFIITTSQGKNVTATAMAGLKMKFLQDDLLNKAYYTKSYVDSRQYAEKKMKEGKVSTISEGILEYNKGTIQSYSEATKARIVQYDEQINTLTSTLDEIETEMKGQTPKPGSSTDIQIKLLEDRLEGAKMNKETAITSAAKAADVLSSNNPKSINDKGYSMQMQSNIMGDLQMAAQNYSMINAERTLKVNEVKMQDRKEKHDVGMERMRFSNKKLFESYMTDELETRKENELKLRAKYGDIKGSGDDEDGNSWYNSRLKELGLSGGVSGVSENVVESEELRDVGVSRFIEEKQEELIDQEINLYTQIFTNKDTNQMLLPSNVNLEGLSKEDRKNITSVEGSDSWDSSDNTGELYVSPTLFKKIMNLEGNYKPFKTHMKKKLADSEFSSSETEAYRNKITDINAELLQLKNNKNLYFKNVKDNLELAIKLTDNDNRNIYEEDEDGNVRIIPKSEYLNKELEDLKTQEKINWKDIRYGTGLPLGTEIVIKEPNNPIWADVKSGKISKTIKRIDKNGDEKTILNPNLFEIKQFYKSNASKAKNAQWRFQHKDKNIQHVMNGRIQATLSFVKNQSINLPLRKDGDGITDYRTTKGILEQLPVINFNTIKKSQGDNYNELMKISDNISKGKEEWAEARAGFKFYNPIAEDLGMQDEGSQITDLIVGRSNTFPLGAKDIENQKIEPVMQMILAKQALGLDGTEIYHQRENNEPTVATNSEVVDLIGRWENGQLQTGSQTDQSDYSIKYIPAIGDQKFSTYEIKERRKKKKSASQPGAVDVINIEKHIIKVPVNQDRNELNPRNKKTNLIIDDLLDPKTDSHKRNFGDGSNVYVTKNNGVYNIETNYMRYNKFTDEMEVLPRERIPADLQNIDMSSVDPWAANDVYKHYTSKITGWAVHNLKQREFFRAKFTEYLKEKYKEDNIISQLSDEVKKKDWDNFIKGK